MMYSLVPYILRYCCRTATLSILMMLVSDVLMIAHLAEGLASFYMLLPILSCVSYAQFPICLDNLSLSIITHCFLNTDPHCTCTSYMRFVVVSNELQIPSYGRSASGADRPILIPGIIVLVNNACVIVCKSHVFSSTADLVDEARGKQESRPCKT